LVPSICAESIEGGAGGESRLGKTCFEAMQGFHAGWRKSGIGGAEAVPGGYPTRPYTCRIRGSRASRSPSPTTFRPRTVSMMAAPGNIVIQGAWVMNCLPSLRMFPQLAM